MSHAHAVGRFFLEVLEFDKVEEGPKSDHESRKIHEDEINASIFRGIEWRSCW
jgi:hypothetical protein